MDKREKGGKRSASYERIKPILKKVTLLKRRFIIIIIIIIGTQKKGNSVQCSVCGSMFDLNEIFRVAKHIAN